MTGNKKTATRVGAQAAECEGIKNMSISIINHAEAPVNDIETWSDALDYWCKRYNDEEEEVER